MATTLWRSLRAVQQSVCDVSGAVCRDLPAQSRRQTVLSTALAASFLAATAALLASYH